MYFAYAGDDLDRARRLAAFIKSNYVLEPINGYNVTNVPNILIEDYDDISFEVMLDEYPHIMSVESITDHADGTFTFHNVTFHDDPQQWEDISCDLSETPADKLTFLHKIEDAS